MSKVSFFMFVMAATAADRFPFLLLQTSPMLLNPYKKCQKE
jgi:hypothetical protein